MKAKSLFGDLFKDVLSINELAALDVFNTSARKSAWKVYDDRLTLEVILPGVSKDNVKIQIDPDKGLIRVKWKVSDGYSIVTDGSMNCPLGDFKDRIVYDQASCVLHEGILFIEIPTTKNRNSKETFDLPVS